MKTLIAVATVMAALVGCSGGEPAPVEKQIQGPPAADVERALAAAWDPGMQSATRPAVRWADNTACAMGRTFAVATMQAAPRCDDVAFDSSGAITVGWHKGQKLSETGLGLGLAQWKLWLWTSSLKDTKAIDEDRVWFDAQIAAAGL
jgi:hypothetical protein